MFFLFADRLLKIIHESDFAVGETTNVSFMKFVFTLSCLIDCYCLENCQFSSMDEVEK